MVDFRGNAALRGVKRVLLAYFACLFSISDLLKFEKEIFKATFLVTFLQ